MTKPTGGPKRKLIVAVTGPTGEIGKPLIAALERTPQVGRVIAMARRSFDPAARGWSKVQYRSGDIASLNREPCRCGRTLARMSKVIGRRDDMLVLSGVNVYPSEVERVLLAEPALAPDYLLVVDSREVPSRLIACCEFRTAGASRSLAPERGVSAIEDRLRDELGVRVRLHMVPQGTVPRTEVGKAVRLVSWDKGEPPVPGL